MDGDKTLGYWRSVRKQFPQGVLNEWWVSVGCYDHELRVSVGMIRTKRVVSLRYESDPAVFFF